MATTDPCQLLARLLEEPSESEWLEFKTANSDPDGIGRYVSALANSAMLSDRDRGYLVFGVRDGTREPIGTSVVLGEMKKGGEDFRNWLTRLLEPRILLEFLDFECDSKRFAILVIEPTYDRPVRFSGNEYIRVGQNCRSLRDLPEHERALWLATGRRRFEHAIAASGVKPSTVQELLDERTLYSHSGDPESSDPNERLRKLVAMGFINDNMEGGFDITNLGAVLLAKDIRSFPSIAGKAVRIIKYAGVDKRKSEFEQEGTKGYAVGFSGMIRWMMSRIPQEEIYRNGVRRMVPMYPEVAIREIIANALIHQDFTLTGASPVIEIYSDRIEVTNPGNSLIDTDRMVDERRSRNEKLASTMRQFGLCEERGGGLDKTLLALEELHLPAPEFVSSADSMRVIMVGRKQFGEMTKAEKQRSCFYHCVLRWITRDYMSNSSLRERFSLPDEDYQSVSGVISDMVKSRRIKPADPNQGRRNARYVPYWA